MVSTNQRLDFRYPQSEVSSQLLRGLGVEQDLTQPPLASGRWLVGKAPNHGPLPWSFINSSFTALPLCCVILSKLLNLSVVHLRNGKTTAPSS